MFFNPLLSSQFYYKYSIRARISASFDSKRIMQSGSHELDRLEGHQGQVVKLIHHAPPRAPGYSAFRTNCISLFILSQIIRCARDRKTYMYKDAHMCTHMHTNAQTCLKMLKYAVILTTIPRSTYRLAANTVFVHMHANDLSLQSPLVDPESRELVVHWLPQSLLAVHLVEEPMLWVGRECLVSKYRHRILAMRHRV